MSEYETWSLIIGAISSMGTLAAVGVSLWLASGRIKKFSIKSIRVSVKMKSGENKPYESFLYVTFKNYQNVKMEIFSLDLAFHKTKEKSSSHSGWSCNNEFIPSLSQYDLPLKLEQGWVNGSLQEADKIRLSVKTSFGEKTVDFPDKYKKALFVSMEVPKAQNENEQEAA